jgi:cytochrome c
MDDLKFNKLAAAFLLAVLLAMGGYKLSEIMIPHNELAQNSYPIEVTEVESASSEVAAPAGPEPILALLAGADIAAGQKQRNAQPAMYLMRAVQIKLDQLSGTW